MAIKKKVRAKTYEPKLKSEKSWIELIKMSVTQKTKQTGKK